MPPDGARNDDAATSRLKKRYIGKWQHWVKQWWARRNVRFFPIRVYVGITKKYIYGLPSICNYPQSSLMTVRYPPLTAHKPIKHQMTGVGQHRREKIFRRRYAAYTDLYFVTATKYDNTKLFCYRANMFLFCPIWLPSPNNFLSDRINYWSYDK